MWRRLVRRALTVRACRARHLSTQALTFVCVRRARTGLGASIVVGAFARRYASSRGGPRRRRRVVSWAVDCAGLGFAGLRSMPCSATYSCALPRVGFNVYGWMTTSGNNATRAWTSEGHATRVTPPQRAHAHGTRSRVPTLRIKLQVDLS